MPFEIDWETIAIPAALISAVAIPSLLYPYFDFSRHLYNKRRTENGPFLVPAAPEKKHALVVLADMRSYSEEMQRSFANTANLAYDGLRARGYGQENIHVVIDENLSPNDSECPTYAPSREGLESAITALSSTVSSQDSCFMYFLGHGNNTGYWTSNGRSLLNLTDEYIREEELAEMLSDIKASHSVAFFNLCYSGGFAERLGQNNTIGISVGRRTKAVHAGVSRSVKKQYGEEYMSNFAFFFLSGLKGEYPDGTRTQTDNYALEELFDYAAKQARQHGRWWPYRTTPQLVYGNVDPKTLHI